MLRGWLLLIATCILVTATLDPSGAIATGHYPSPGKQPARNCVQTDASDSRIQGIIHATAVLAALADGGLAQIPGVGSAVVVPTIQAGMVGFIGKHYGCHMDASTAIAVLTWLGSDRAKQALFKEFVGYIPIAGNLFKAGLTWSMTEGIGKIASTTLSCPQSSEALLKDALNQSDTEVVQQDVTAANLYHLVSDYLEGGITSEVGWSE
jgi:uncharacterized protein (DUF697 family)